LPKNDEGEFELILGNRQLISVFLIVVVMLGVFFSMGYVVGRNSSPAAATPEARADKTTADTHPPDSTSPDGSSSAEPTQPPANTSSNASGDQPPAETPPSITQPEKPAAAAAAPKPAPAAKEPKPKPSPASPGPEHAAIASQVAAGQYWQVVATARPDAEIIAEALAKKGFHAVLAPAPKDGVFRVLVGPLADAPTQAQTRTNLESAGFKNPIMRKY
jgi:cytoskeletal protein RodZ